MLPVVMDAEELAKLLERPLNSNLLSVYRGLESYGLEMGLNQAHRLVPYLAQLGHESGNFHLDKEVWGPTAAQERYDTRTGLGNTPERDGDGYLYRGRGPIQVTGKANYRAFTKWVWNNINPKAPDFVDEPDLLNTDPWEGLSPIWYWSVNNLNRFSDAGDMRGLTRRINGGYNGLQDRLNRYDRLALNVLGYGFNEMEILRFQRNHKLSADGIIGPITRKKLHERLKSVHSTQFIHPRN